MDIKPSLPERDKKIAERKFNFPYTPKQLEILNKLIDWSYDTKASITMTLEGAAGTGKTTILKDFIKHCKFKSGIGVTATTHKAVEVVSRLTGHKGYTIQKLCGLRPNFNIENFNINDVRFDQIGTKHIRNFNLIIVDEASQLNSSLKRFIEVDAKAFTVKILYVGDSYQLPPVKERISEVFTTKNKVILTDIMRQDQDNPLVKILTTIRRDIDGKTGNFIKAIKRTPIAKNGLSGYFSLDKDEFKKSIIEYFGSDHFLKDINFCRYTGFTNNNVLQWNKFIRNNIIEDSQYSILTIDDLLTSYKTLVDEFFAPTIVNSDDYIIDEINPYTNQQNIDGFIVRLRSVSNGFVIPNYLFIVNHTNRLSYTSFLRIINKLLRDAKTANSSYRARRWKEFYNFKDANLLLASIFDDGGKTIVGKDLDYGYALTTHKTQGSTYTNVFVNLRNIIYDSRGNPYRNIELRNRLAYVALSRASEKAIIFL